ncbi:MAG: DUF2182 domain-containing protein [Acidimicrobiales bacterium]
MNTSARAAPLPGLTPYASLLLLAAAGAWVGVILVARGMQEMPGTMGLALGPFIGVWTLMMAAMMLPSAAPFVALYTRTFTSRRATRFVNFVAGYLLAWALASLPAYAVGRLLMSVVDRYPGEGTAVVAAIFAACGLYQLTPVKSRCLARCRSPIALSFKYGSYGGALRDLRVGLSHGAFCLACCWALMAVLFSFGIMNVPAMILLAVVVLAEKVWARGPAFGRVVGAVALALAVAAVVHPGLAPGLHPAAHLGGMNGM